MGPTLEVKAIAPVKRVFASRYLALYAIGKVLFIAIPLGRNVSTGGRLVWVCLMQERASRPSEEEREHGQPGDHQPYHAADDDDG